MHDSKDFVINRCPNKKNRTTESFIKTIKWLEIDQQVQWKMSAHFFQAKTPSEVVGNLSCTSDIMKVFTKETLPKRHHYSNSGRIGDVLIDMKEEWLVYK